MLQLYFAFSFLGRVEVAAKILDDLGGNIKDMLEITIRKINLERRRGNDDKVDELYLKCIADAKNSQMSSHFATKYARYLYKVSRCLSYYKIKTGLTHNRKTLKTRKNSNSFLM